MEADGADGGGEGEDHHDDDHHGGHQGGGGPVVVRHGGRGVAVVGQVPRQHDPGVGQVHPG